MRTIPWLTASVVGLLIAGCAGISSAPSQEERQALAPTGKLRVALYLGAPASIIRGATPDESKCWWRKPPGSETTRRPERSTESRSNRS